MKVVQKLGADTVMNTAKVDLQEIIQTDFLSIIGVG